ncbi:MAG: DUF2341 domain-containing protein [Candidatus Thermoplasmatota archaeon]
MIKNKIINIRGQVIISILTLILLISSLSQAQPLLNQKTSNQNLTYQYTIYTSTKDLIFNTIGEYTLLSLTDGNHLTDPGKPMIPYKEIKIALPEEMNAMDVQILEAQQQTLDGKYNIFPAQPVRTTNEIRENFNFIEPDPSIYKSSQPYPTKTIEFLYQTDLAGQNIAVIQVNPIQYIPLTQQIILYTKITINIIGKPGYICGDYLPKALPESERISYQQRIEKMVENPEQVILRERQEGGMMTLGVPPGNYEYVIITQSSWVNNFQPLADWKTKKGTKATIVTLDWIYNQGGYTGDNQNKIRLFVQDAHQNWGATYFLLGGDTSIVPHKEKYYRLYLSGNWEDIYAPADTYYADYDSDFLCEVNVGRASVTTTTMITTFINKVLTYEQNPPLTSYALDASLWGFDLDSSTRGEYLKQNIDNTYIPASWTMSNVYDSHSGNHETYVKNYFNTGQHIVNHCDHGDSSSMGVGSYNHGYYLSTSEVEAFYNGDQQSILYSMACYVASFDVYSCIAEYFVRDTNGGCIAFIGNSRYGIYSAGDTSTYSFRYDREFFEAIFADGFYNIGKAFSHSKDDSPHGDDYYKCIFDELNLLGEPEFEIWTANPMSMSVSHPSQLSTGPSQFTVYVTSGGSPLSNAHVCLWKGTEVYLEGDTNANGYVTLTPSPQTGGTMYVTVTKHNYIPYLGSANVPYHNPPYIPSNPSPAHLEENVDLNADLSWNGGDPDNNPTTYDIYFGTTNPPPFKQQIGPYPGNQYRITYDPGSLQIFTTYYWKIIANDDDPLSPPSEGPIWQFTTTDNIPPEWRKQGQSAPVIPPGGTVVLYGQGRDNIGLGLAYLATNETGQWVNFSGGNWWDVNWGYCKKITINHTFVNGDLFNFPVLISTISSEFIGHTQPDGDDFVFIDKTNTTKYSHEIEYYNSQTGELTAWVKIPFLSSSQDTILYLYYGNPDCENQEDPEGTWDNGFITVYHMKGSNWNEIKDSTANHWDITNMGGNPIFNQPGKINTCVEYDGNGDYLQSNLFSLSSDSAHTGSAWVYCDGGHTTQRYIFQGRSGYIITLLIWPDGRFVAYTDTTSGPAYVFSTTKVNVSKPAWYYVTTRVDPNTDKLDLYINGVKEAGTTISGEIKPETLGLNIGTWYANNLYWMDGKIDEIRVSNVARNENWIKTEYNNMILSTFVNVGEEKQASGGSKYGSPMILSSGPNEWVWSNFTWQNPSIPAGTKVGWRIYYIDASKNLVATSIMSFTIVSSLQPNPPEQPVDSVLWHTNPNDKNKGICGAGIMYDYTTTSTQTILGDIYYKFYWGDGSDSGWLGPYTSGEIVSAGHIYSIDALGDNDIRVVCKINDAESVLSVPLRVRMYRVGDTSGNDNVGFDDINPFVLMLSGGKDVYYTRYPNGYWFTGDITLNKLVSFDDINPFVGLLTGG